MIKASFAPQDEPESPSSAGYLAGLNAKFRERWTGQVYLVEAAEADGYISARPFVDARSEVVVLRVPDRLRIDFEHTIRDMLERSPAGLLLIFLETNGELTNPSIDLPRPRGESIESLGIDEFLSRSTRGELPQDVVFQVSRDGGVGWGQVPGS